MNIYIFILKDPSTDNMIIILSFVFTLEYHIRCEMDSLLPIWTALSSDPFKKEVLNTSVPIKKKEKKSDMKRQLPGRHCVLSVCPSLYLSTPLLCLRSLQPFIKKNKKKRADVSNEANNGAVSLECREPRQHDCAGVQTVAVR